MSEIQKQIEKEIGVLLSRNANQAAIDMLCDITSNCKSFINSILFKNKDYKKSINVIKNLIHFDEIMGKQPQAEYYSNLIYLLHNSGNYKEAYEVGKNSIENLKLTECSDLWYNYAVLLKDMGKLQDSAYAFKKSRDINPDFAMTHYQLSNVLMALGHYKEGVEEDEWRFKAHSGLARFRNRFNAPDWDGSKNKEILVFSEQGFGDAIQNARYLNKLKSISKKLILEVQKEMFTLFDGHPDVDEVLPRDFKETQVPKFPNHDYVVSINSLPYWFDRDYNNTPTESYLKANLHTEAQSRLKPVYENFDPNKKKIGLIWAGSQWHVSDKYRSCFLKEFAPLFELENLQFFSFQTGPMVRSWCHGKELLWQGSENYDIVNLLDNCENIIPRIFDSMEYVKDFNDTAILLNDMDLLISVDTATAHLAGSLGKKVWLLLPNPHEWRWRKKWYPEMRLMVQPEEHNWPKLIEKVSQELKEF